MDCGKFLVFVSIFTHLKEDFCLKVYVFINICIIFYIVLLPLTIMFLPPLIYKVHPRVKYLKTVRKYSTRLNVFTVNYYLSTFYVSVVLVSAAQKSNSNIHINETIL